MIKVVILDFDDTLCMTEQACFHLENRIAVKLGFEPMTAKTHISNWGKSLRLAIEERIPGIKADDFMREFDKYMPEAIDEGVMDNIPAATLEGLDNLIAKGYQLAILTSRAKAEVKHMLSPEHPLSSRVKYFHYNELSDFVKPDPRVFDKTFKEFEITPREAVYVGDSPSDALACNLAGVHFIASLESGLRTKFDFEKYYVDSFVYTLSDLDEEIIKLTKKWELLEDHEDARAEFLIEVSEKDEVIGPVARKITHNQTRKPWHRSTQAFLFDKAGNLYFTRRSLGKDTAPGLWTVSAAGHVPWGSDFDETVRREIVEELEVEVTDLEFIEKFSIDYGSEREILGLYFGICEGEPHFNPEEVMEISKFPLDEVISDFNTGRFVLSGGAIDTFRHFIANGKLIEYHKKHFPA